MPRVVSGYRAVWAVATTTRRDTYTTGIAPYKNRHGMNEAIRILAGAEARALTRKQRWELLSPYLLQHGRGCLAYSTLQDGLDYFIVEGKGYIAYHLFRHRLLAPKGIRIVVSDPIAPAAEFHNLTAAFTGEPVPAFFAQVSEECASVLADCGYKVNALGIETEIELGNFSLAGKRRAQLRQWINKARREGVEVFEASITDMTRMDVELISNDWLRRKGGHELLLLTRPLVLDHEPHVRYFWARRQGRLIGFVIFDPLFHAGAHVGYYHNFVRVLNNAPHGTSDLVTIFAIEKFRAENVQLLTFGMSPLVSLESGRFECNRWTLGFLKLVRKYGEFLYPFAGNESHKRKYDGNHKPVYICGTNGTGVSEVLAGMKALRVL
jgi:phosphatidylglycerol lysyltransferase